MRETASAPPHLLPLRRDPLIGREQGLEQLRSFLADDTVGLITLTGPGGIGKTRLALQVAADATPDDFPHGVHFVPLAPVNLPGLVVPTIARALGLAEVGDRTVLEHLREFLRPKRLLLVLDNFEHVLDAAPLIAELAAAAPGVTILATSRIRLRLYGEHEFPVPPLALPAPGSLPDLAALPDYSAVALFVRRARAVRPDFALTETTAPVVAEICARLDGLPLAIELAAARIRLLAPQALLARLSRRLHLLTGGARDLPARQQTLRGTIDWSYALLGPGERRLFARLAVFVGGWTPEAAEAICNPAGTLPLDALEGLASLLDQSLIQREEGPAGESRFMLLETIREYAWEQLHAQGEEDLLRQRHAEYYLALAEEAAPSHFWIPQEIWLARLPFEFGNLRAALAWFRDEAERAPADTSRPNEHGLRLAGALWRFWDVRGYWRESREWLEGTLAWAGPGQAPRTAGRATALLGLGMLEFDEGHDKAAAARLAESLAIRRELGDAPGIALGTFFVGLAALRRGDWGEGHRWLAESLAQFEQLGDRWGRGMVLHMLGEGVMLDDPALAQRHLEESAALFRESGDKWGLSMPLTTLGRLALFRGDYAAARAACAEGLALRRAVGYKWFTAISLVSLGDVARCQGEHAEAAALYREGLTLYEELGRGDDRAWPLYGLGQATLGLGDVARAAGHFRDALALEASRGSLPGQARCLAGVGIVAALVGERARAARLFGAVAALLEAGVRPEPHDRRDYERASVAARERIDEAMWRVSCAEGRVLPREQVVAEALAIRPAHALHAHRSATAREHPAPAATLLSRREREVAALIARGLSNREIAAALAIAEKTAASHVDHILTKLNARSRAQIAVWAVQRGLGDSSTA